MEVMTMNYKILHENGQVVYKDWCSTTITDNKQLIKVLLDSCKLQYEIEENSVLIKKNFFYKKYQLDIVFFTYPEKKSILVREIDKCLKIIDDFICSLQKTSYEIDITTEMTELKEKLSD